VGIVADFPAGTTAAGDVGAKLYHAADFGAADPMNLEIRFAGTAPASFTARLRELAASVDGTLMIRGTRRFDDVFRGGQRFYRTLALGLGIVTLSVLALSSAGIYAMMSLAVARRRREIGIRAALGANPRQLLRSIFTRAAMQLAAGAVVGLAIAAALEYASSGDTMAGHGTVVLPVVALFTIAVGLLAMIGPARRGLRIDPTEALRAE
jgi:putative ABC transport system permease protein